MAMQGGTEVKLTLPWGLSSSSECIVHMSETRSVLSGLVFLSCLACEQRDISSSPTSNEFDRVS